MVEIEQVQQAPLLGIQMKPAYPVDQVAVFDEALDRIAVMTKQGGSYRTKDYMGRRRKRSDISAEDEVDPACREKMCEWSYKVCDHFNVGREIVAFSFSFLDRFIDRCSCDRTAFKLAAMTSLYIATKMLNMKQISLASLSELSRGEFQAEHLAQMERIILHSLDYRMNPPTVQSFIEQLRACFPEMDEESAAAVYQRAVFYSELCVYDYCFVTEERYQIAIAAILNAFQDVHGTYIASHLQKEFLKTLDLNVTEEVNMINVQKAQGRLWYLYSCSAQVQVDESQPLYVYNEFHQKQSSSAEFVSYTHSPVSVDMRQTYSH